MAAGSGNNSLVHGYPPERHPDAVSVDRNPPVGPKRLNAATHIGMPDLIRTASASANKVSVVPSGTDCRAATGPGRIPGPAGGTVRR